ncbi:hypothetical protein CEXT_750391 [Caerostris extrusa]|uniref:Uncharacterized protein n=1 Tax=Caerostris extrusa TaxID=172846 RepID=A0AAV4TNR1_CAEEX|nr:hypothetical protein CEXT_750391 [Caerostris extrusa]
MPPPGFEPEGRKEEKKKPSFPHKNETFRENNLKPGRKQETFKAALGVFKERVGRSDCSFYDVTSCSEGWALMRFPESSCGQEENFISTDSNFDSNAIPSYRIFDTILTKKRKFHFNLSQPS